MAGRHLSPPPKKRVPTIRLINIPPQRSAQRSPPINNRRARRENRLATGCSPSLSLPRGARAGDRPTDRQAGSHGQARQVQPRRGGVLPAGGSGRRQVPVHDGESAAAVGLHPQGVRDRVPAAAADGGRRRDGEPGARHRGLLPLPHHGRHVRHHRRHRRPHPRCVRVYTCLFFLVSCLSPALHCTARTNVYMSLQSSFIHSHGPSSLLSVCVFVFAKKQNKKMQ